MTREIGRLQASASISKARQLPRTIAASNLPVARAAT